MVDKDGEGSSVEGKERMRANVAETMHKYRVGKDGKFYGE